MSFLSNFFGMLSSDSANAAERAEEQVAQMAREGKISREEAREKIAELRAKRERLLEAKERFKEM